MINRDDLEWESLDTEIHNVGDFSSEAGIFTTYLRVYANRDQANGIAQTHVLLYVDKIVGYYTIKCTKIKVNDSEANLVHGRGDVQFVPAVEVPYLAVHKDFLRQGLGQIVLDEITTSAYELAQEVGCRYIFLQAVNDDWLVKWYVRNKFEVTPFENIEAWTIPMRYIIPQLRSIPPEEPIEDEAGV